MDANAAQASWEFLLPGFAFTVCVETPILLLGLSPRHSLGRRLFCGLWLNACSYPIVVLVLPMLIDIKDDRWLYLLIAEVFAPASECALFWAAFGTRAEWGARSMWRDFAVITLANLASFAPAEIVLQLHLHQCLAPWLEQFYSPEQAAYSAVGTRYATHCIFMGAARWPWSRGRPRPRKPETAGVNSLQLTD